LGLLFKYIYCETSVTMELDETENDDPDNHHKIEGNVCTWGICAMHNRLLRHRDIQKTLLNDTVNNSINLLNVCITLRQDLNRFTQCHM
jgi:hypothetical protein